MMVRIPMEVKQEGGWLLAPPVMGNDINLNTLNFRTDANTPNEKQRSRPSLRHEVTREKSGQN